jgi:urease accessory protein
MRFPISASLVLLASAAQAHVGAGGSPGFAAGFAHPLGGLDHVLAMVAVGLFAANLGGRALVAVPLSFLALMGVGGVLGMFGFGLPAAEIGIALSVVLLGLAVALPRRWPLGAAAALVGVFALFHGHAHGAEMPLGAAAAGYAAGFVAATALLHLGGLAAAMAAAPRSRAIRFGGGAIACLGGAILVGMI